ncbi:F-box domain-containing protein [Mycena venus]|uniref:F-box domain-containing protein n=1 Tax=Mycena venus TaxID=2733690 RepID=A0A8H7D2E2_9AGAR|nr:F-box domain-containing protein [Mycena venus]
MAAAESIYSCPQCMTLLDPSNSSLPSLNPTLVPRDILETNDPPLESQIPFLRDFVSNGRARLSALNAKIASLQSAMDRLRKERDAIAVDIRKHEGGLSPLRRMPPEILTHIFAFNLLSRYFNERALWTVSAVCARWRTIVLSQPGFWTTIDYNHSEKFNDTLNFRLQTQLRRSSQMPLNIKFCTSDDDAPTFEEMCMLQTVCGHAARWKTVSIEGRKELFNGLQSFVRDQFASLVELSIEVMYNDDDVPLLDVFHDAPRLQRVAFNTELWSWPVMLALPGSQLLEYSGSSTWGGHLHALRNATSLVECTLEIHGHDPHTIPSTPILLPSLLRLSLSESQFLECLETPALLELYCGDASAVLPFLGRQNCKLQKLVLWNPANGADLTQIVDAAPTIENLALAFPLPATFAHHFRSRPNLAPSLRCLSTGLARDPPTIEDDFMQGIESRWQRGPIQSVKVYGIGCSPSFVERLELLQADGLEFTPYTEALPLIYDVVPSQMMLNSVDYPNY